MIFATVTFVRTEDGGRSTPIFTGYRPQFFFEGKDYESGCIDLLSERAAWPGDTVEVRIHLSDYARTALNGAVKPGMTFELHEGAKNVAGGIVTNVED
jgi:elongation factor Tu